MKSLADRLIWARTRANLSQQALADLAHVAQGTIGNLESQARHGSKKIAAIANALGVDALWLAEGRGAPPPEVIEGSEVHRRSAPRADVQRLLAAIKGLEPGQVLKIAALVEALRQPTSTAHDESPLPVTSTLRMDADGTLIEEWNAPAEEVKRAPERARRSLKAR